jgi:hypothetical protein
VAISVSCSDDATDAERTTVARWALQHRSSHFAVTVGRQTVAVHVGVALGVEWRDGRLAVPARIFEWEAAAGMPTFRPDKRASPLLSQTATGRWPRGNPWENQPESGRRFTSQPDHRPARRYEPGPAATGSPHTSRRFSPDRRPRRPRWFDDGSQRRYGHSAHAQREPSPLGVII